jgi:hypothetical protein
VQVLSKEGDLSKVTSFVSLMKEEKVEHVPVVVTTLIRTYLQVRTHTLRRGDTTIGHEGAPAVTSLGLKLDQKRGEPLTN